MMSTALKETKSIWEGWNLSAIRVTRFWLDTNKTSSWKNTPECAATGRINNKR